MKSRWIERMRAIRRAMDESTLKSAQVTREVERQRIRMQASGGCYHPLSPQGVWGGWYGQ